MQSAAVHLHRHGGREVLEAVTVEIGAPVAVAMVAETELAST